MKSENQLYFIFLLDNPFTMRWEAKYYKKDKKVWISIFLYGIVTTADEISITPVPDVNSASTKIVKQGH